MSLKDNVEKIDRRLQWGIFLLATGIGCAFTAMVYAHSTFVSKEVYALMFDMISEIKQDVREIKVKLK